MNWYGLEVRETVTRLATSDEGLTEEQAKERISEYGPNRLVEAEKVSRLAIALHQFKSPLIYILIVAAIITAILEEYTDTGVIVAVVILNAIIGYVQEYKAEESVRALKKMVVPKARVIRGGSEKEIDSEELVPGDAVLLASGSKVPADLRLSKAIELRIDESLLTGESVPASKLTSAIKEKQLPPGDQRNMAFMGTIVVSGRAKGIVVETGQRTLLGEIAEEVREAPAVKTPLQDKLERFAKFLGVVVVGFSAVVFAVGIMRGASVSDMFLTAVAMAVSAIPEGLPVAVTIAMAIGVARMARRNAIVRRLPAVETLGSTNVIGSDKTGTLTKNEMTVRLVYDGNHTYELSGSGYDPTGEFIHEGVPVDVREVGSLLQVLRIGLVCNESNVYEEAGRYKVDGDPTEGALVVAAMKADFSEEEERDSYAEIAVIPFESERGYMASLNAHGGKKYVFVKGAPERVLDMCSRHEGKHEEIDRDGLLELAARFAMEGLRVLAFAYKEASPEAEDLTHAEAESGLMFAGMQGMIDPPRPEVLEAVEGCKKAGIRTVMITGDHVVTALAIARKLGIDGDRAQALTGRELEGMSDEELFHKAGEVSVYARVSPQHKLRITQQIQKHGKIVAVTGDGVNDAPALKAAHIGIAMGKSGTDVAKEASDMVLADDNFASILAAVEEGRVVYDNIKKVTLFLISCGFGELVAILATVVLGLPIPYIPAQILWLNLVTNGLQDVALAFEPGEKGVLARPPRDPKESILSSSLIQKTFLMGIIMAIGTVFMFIMYLKAGASLEKARTAALTTMVFFQFCQAFNCRSETESVFRMHPMRNPFLFFSAIAAFFAQLAVLYVPTLQWIFRTVPLSGFELLEIVAVAFTIIVAVEGEKWARRVRGLGSEATAAGRA